MWPILFQVGEYRVGTYGVIVALAFLAGLFVARRLARRDGLDPIRVNDLGLAVLFFGFLGSKLLGMLVALASGAPVSWDELRNAGAVHGGLLAAIVTAFLLARRMSLPLPQVLDAYVPAGALGQSIGRLGCAAAGCCFGSQSGLPWAITFHSPQAAELGGVPLHVGLHPVQFYDAAAHLVLFLALLWMHRRKLWHGRLFGVWCISEGVVRASIETFRGDSGRGVWFDVEGLSTGRLTAVAFILLGVLFLGWTRGKQGRGDQVLSPGQRPVKRRS